MAAFDLGLLVRHKSTLRGSLDLILDLLKQVRGQIDLSLHFLFRFDHRRRVRHIRLQLETSQVGNIVEWDSLQVEVEEAAFRDFTVWLVADQLPLINLKLTFVALAFQNVLVTHLERVRILVSSDLAEFEAIHTMLAPVARPWPDEGRNERRVLNLAEHSLRRHELRFD